MTDPEVSVIELKGDQAKALLKMLGILPADSDTDGATVAVTGSDRANSHKPQRNSVLEALADLVPFVSRKRFERELKEGHERFVRLDELARKVFAKAKRAEALEGFAESVGIEAVNRVHVHENGNCVNEYTVELDFEKAQAGWFSVGYEFKKVVAEGTKDFDPNDVTRGGMPGGEQR